MRTHPYIQLRYAAQGGVGYEIEVSDDHDKARIGFLMDSNTPRNPATLAAWCLGNPRAAVILEAAIERNEAIGTSFGTAEIDQVLKQRALLEEETLEVSTTTARGKRNGMRL